MKLLNIILTGIILLTCTNIALGQQREFFIEDLYSDDQISMDINSDTTKMKIGIDAIGGWIKILNNSPLWFGTDDKRRLTIDQAGNVGINTSTPKAKLHINEGDVRLEAITTPTSSFDSYKTGVDFYKGTATSDYLGGIEYSNPGLGPTQIATRLVSNAGLLSFATDGSTRLSVNPSGEVRVHEFPVNQGTNNVMVTADGTLTTTIKGKLVINPSDLNFNRTPPVGFYVFHKVLGNTNQFGVNVQAFCPIDLPENAKITRADIYYIDDSAQNLRVRFRRTQNDTNTSNNTTIFTSSGSPSNSTSDIKFATANTNWTVGDPNDEHSHLFIELFESGLGISSIILSYEY